MVSNGNTNFTVSNDTVVIKIEDDCETTFSGKSSAHDQNSSSTVRRQKSANDLFLSTVLDVVRFNSFNISETYHYFFWCKQVLAHMHKKSKIDPKLVFLSFVVG